MPKWKGRTLSLPRNENVDFRKSLEKSIDNFRRETGQQVATVKRKPGTTPYRQPRTLRAGGY